MKPNIFFHMFSLNLLINDADILQILLIHTSLIPTLEAIPRRQEEAKNNKLENPQKSKMAPK